jgi:hypothetical protein
MRLNSAQTGAVIADLSATLNTEFNLPALLSAVAGHLRIGFDAYSAAVVLLDYRQGLGDDGVHVVAEALREGAVAHAGLHLAGPAVVSANDGVITMIDDLASADDTRWPEYRSRALAAGLRAVRAFPIVALQVPLGSVVIHTEDPWGSSRSGTFGQILANLTAVALASGVVDDRRAETSRSIEALLDRGVTVAAATGVLAETLGLDVDEARRVLSRLARVHDADDADYARVMIAAHDADPTNPEPSWARPPVG